jgi:hypothetical protein
MSALVPAPLELTDALPCAFSCARKRVFLQTEIWLTYNQGAPRERQLEKDEKTFTNRGAPGVV